MRLAKYPSLDNCQTHAHPLDCFTSSGGPKVVWHPDICVALFNVSLGFYWSDSDFTRSTTKTDLMLFPINLTLWKYHCHGILCRVKISQLYLLHKWKWYLHLMSDLWCLKSVLKRLSWIELLVTCHMDIKKLLAPKYKHVLIMALCPMKKFFFLQGSTII